ncbi:recombinase family protein [Ruminococcus bovis]|uniref:Recombinase family protein n=1 Tax=Ruminococcus bovis TaxID=2564099 RepID=A0A4P8XTS4_9FIRM|nr:recombinase family protein [Ruminococcus bovis]QCT06406.1 recombinase family protein [Ruminococcus bovis]
MDILSVRNQIKSEGISFRDLPLRVAFYARVSTDYLEQLNSLENQKQYFTEYIGDMPNWEFAGGYIDEGLSGVSTKKREKFNEMIDDALDGKFDLIVTKEVSRFARNTLDSIQYTRQLLANGVAVYFQNDNINTLDDDSEFRLTIMASMAQDESRKISSRVKWGHHQAIKNGVVLGNSNIFGYRKADKRLYIDEEQAAIVRELFELYATGKYSMKNLETYFYNKGVRNTRGNKLAHNTMANIIRNPKYMGYYVGNKVQIIDMFTKKQKFLPEEEWVIFKDETGETVPQIVSEELWKRANEVLKVRSLDVIQKQNKTNHNNLLTGKLICAHCGKPFYRKDSVSKKGTANSAWRCSGKIKNGAESCPSMTIYENEIIPILEDVFKSSQQNINELSELIMRLSEELLNTNEGANRIETLNKSIANEQKKKQKLLQLNIEGRFPDSEFVRMSAECDEEIDHCQEEITAITDQMQNRKDVNKELAEIRSILDLAAESLNGDELDRSFVDRFIKQILVYPEENGMRLEIELNAGGKVVKNLAKSIGRTGKTSKKMIESYENAVK